MELTDLLSAVLHQIFGKSGILSLKIQNHIYGCFIIMEDIAQQKVELTNNTLKNGNFSFDLDKQFAEIGVRYGFIMDTKLVFDSYNKFYKDMWIKYFNEFSNSHDINKVDAVEDSIIEVIQKVVKADEAFFVHSLESGNLSQEWVDKVLNLLNATTRTPQSIEQSTSIQLSENIDTTHNNNNNNNANVHSSLIPNSAMTTIPCLDQQVNSISQNEEVINNALSHAVTEKPIQTTKDNHHSTTKRAKHKTTMNTTLRRVLSKTRRKH